MKKIRITVVGDGDIGKTCMLIVYKDRKFDERYIPTVFDMYSMTIPINNENYTVILQDTAGQEEFDKLRQLAYKDTDVFIICYSVASKDSYDNVKHTWAPEIKRFCPKAKVVLAATKSDLEAVVSRKEGIQLQKTIKAHDFIENSAKLGKNIDETIRLALRAAVGDSRGQNPTRKRQMNCSLL